MSELGQRALATCAEWVKDEPRLKVHYEAEVVEGEPNGDTRTWVLTGRKSITFVYDERAASA